MPETPEQKARREIDADLAVAGWVVQDRDEIDITAGRGVAVREFPMKSGFGFADYLLYLDRKAAGAVEAKPEGTLTGVEAQSAKYAAGLPDNLPAHRRPLPFLFESNGSVTFFTNGLDPVPRSRQVFNFPRPETLAEWVAQPMQLRGRLKELPTLDETRLWKVQGRAIRNLEQSFGQAGPRASSMSTFHEDQVGKLQPSGRACPPQHRAGEEAQRPSRIRGRARDGSPDRAYTQRSLHRHP
jgi:type I restriction enzyme, R subunit